MPLAPIDPLLDQAWFSALGAPLGEGERADIAAWLAGFGIREQDSPRLVLDWAETAELIRAPAGSWWQAEEDERRRLERSVRLDPADRGWIRVNESLHGAAAVAAARAGIADAGLIKVAAGAASYAVYHYLLACGAGVPDEHPFLRKYALFAGGRWPLGVYDGRFALF